MTRRAVGGVRKIARDKWRVSISAGNDTTTGRRLRLDRTVRGTRHDAERELARLLLEAGHAPAPNTTVGAYLLEVYLPHAQATTRLRTHLGYESRIRVHIVPHLGAVKLDALSPYVLDKWLTNLRKGGLGEANLLNTYRVLNTALRQAVRWRMIANNPLDAVTPPRRPRRDITTLTQDQARDLIQASEGTPAHLPIVLALGAGLRRSEIAGLTWADVDLDNATLTIARGVHKAQGDIYTEPPKSETSRRTVSLPEWLCDVLRPYRGLGYVATPGGTIGDPASISRAYKVVARKSGVTLPLRDLRHTHATLLLASGVDLLIVSRRLGHSSIAVTDLYYARPHRSADRDAAARLDLAPTRANSTAQDTPPRA